MKKILTSSILAATMFSLSMNAQAPSWPWAKNAGGPADDRGSSVCADAAGNSFVTGSYNSSTISFGTHALTNSSSANGLDYYLTKYDPSGTVVWAQTATGISNDAGNNVTVDGNGNVYVVGSSNSHSLTFGTTALTGYGYDDVFLVKYDASGNVLWAKNAGGSGNDIGSGVSVDGSGNVYITGYYASPTISFSGTSLTNLGSNYNIFVAKYSPSGALLWAKSGGGSSSDQGNGIAVDAKGNAYVTGFFTSSTCTFNSTSLTNSGGLDMFIVKYDASGNVKWANNPTGVSNESGNGICLDPLGSPHVVGSYNSSVMHFGGSVTTHLVSYDDAFIVKYDTLGVAQWAQTAGGTQNDIGQSIGVDADGSSYITGYYGSSTMNFGSSSITNLGTNNIFVAKYDPAGAIVWAKSVGGTGDDEGAAIGVNWHGEAFITGFYTSASCPIGGNTLTNAGTQDFFIAKLGTATGIKEETETPLQISFTPNPSQGVFSLQFKASAGSDYHTQMTVCDVTGREIKSPETFNTSTFQLDLSSQPNGIYFVTLVNNGAIQRTKLIVSR